jgi:MFS superfamily sulfate permease-like transporter
MVVGVGVKEGILLAIVLSIVLHVQRHYLPRDTVESWDDSGNLQEVPTSPGLVSEPGLVVYHFGVGLFYANAQRLSDEAGELVDVPDPPRWFVLDAKSMDDVDYTGGETLVELSEQLASRKIVFAIANASDHLREELARFGVEAREFGTLADARQAFHEASRSS